MSEYPRILYHDDGHTAVAQSAHHERTDFGDGWSRTPNDKHRRDPGDGMMRTIQPVGPSATVAPPPPPRHQDAPGPVSAGDVRDIIRTEMANHPGLNLDTGGLARAEDVDALHDKIDLLLANLGVEMPAGDETLPGEAEPRKRRGRPPGSTNKLTTSTTVQE